MTFAHELQHFIQRSNHRQIWPASSFILHIVRHFPVEISDALGLKTWSDIPHERDARIVAKRIVEGLFAEEDINRLIKKRLEFAVDDGDAADWQFINGISSSDVYDFCAATREIFQNLKPYKRDCERLLKRMVKVIPQLRDVDLDSLF